MANMFDENGNYIKTEWKPGDRITAGKLNKIEESLEAINNNDIERHKEADERLDTLEEQNEAVEERFDELEDLVADNKTEVEVLIYENNVKMNRLEQEMNDGIDTVEAIAHTVDDKIAEADASMKAQVAEAEDIVNQGKADMEAMVAEADLKNISSSTLSGLGAALDGVTDDSDYLLTSLELEKEIFIEKSVLISQDIPIIINKTIKGLDNAAILVNNENCITLGDNCVLENLTIVANTHYNSTKPLIRILGENVKINNCKFLSNKSQISTFMNILQGSKHTVIEGCYFSNGGVWDIQISSQGGTTITNCYFDSHLDTETNRSNGIKVSHELVSGDIDASNANMDLLSGENIMITNNYFGTHMDNAIDTFTGATNIIITNNVFDESGTGIIENKTIYRDLPDPNSSSLDNGRNNKKMIISNNVFKGESKFNAYAITFTYTNDTSSEHQIPYGFVVANNIFDSIQKGVNIGAVKNVIVSSNTFTNISAIAINIYKTHSIKIYDNAISGELTGSGLVINDNGEFAELEVYNNTITTSDKNEKKAMILTKSNSHVVIHDNIITNWKVGILTRLPDDSKNELFNAYNNTFIDCDYSMQLGGQPNFILLKNNTTKNSNALLHSSSSLKYGIVHSVGNTCINTPLLYNTSNITKLIEHGNTLFNE